ncbi:MAG: hypothetical protein N3A69_10580, partial [Leptospiraceae bacterium]|nr:hypothetical protein [Leptospiraceae bacterium]
MNLSYILQRKQNRIKFFIQTYRKKLKTLSVYRVFSFLAVVISAALSYLYREISFLGFVPILLLFLFIFFIYTYQKTESFLQRLQTFKTFIDREIFRAQRKISNLARETFENQTENFYKDLDILGKNSLYNFLDTTITKHGNQLFLKSILQTEPLSINEIRKRQNAIQELCESKYFSNKVLRLFNEISANNGYTKISLAKFSFSTLEYFQKHFLQKYFRIFLVINYLLVFFFLLMEKFQILSALLLFQLVFAYWNFRENSKLKKQIQNFIEKIENKERLLTYISKKNFQQDLLKNIFPLRKDEVKELFFAIKQVSRKAKVWDSPLFSFFFNVFFLWDFFVFQNLLKFEIQYKSKMTQVLEGLE